jgi:hypothetical protein
MNLVCALGTILGSHAHTSDGLVAAERNLFGLIEGDDELKATVGRTLGLQLFERTGMHRVVNPLKEDHTLVWFKDAPLGANYILAHKGFANAYQVGPNTFRLLTRSQQQGVVSGFIPIGSHLLIVNHGTGALLDPKALQRLEKPQAIVDQANHLHRYHLERDTLTALTIQVNPN